MGTKIKDNGIDMDSAVPVVYKHSPPCAWDRMNKNGLDKRKTDNAVYRSYISCRFYF